MSAPDHPTECATASPAAYSLDDQPYLHYLAETYRMAYTAPSAFFDKLHAFNPDFQNVQYVNTAELNNEVIEDNDRRIDVLYYAGGVLAQPVKAADLRIEIKNDKFPFNNVATISASTTKEAVSQSSTAFVFWIRVGNELMRVNKVEERADSRVLHVERGFESTIALDYEAGTRLFAPCYRESGYPGLENGRGLQYFAEPGGVLRRDELIREWERLVLHGDLDGLWMDVFGATVGVRRAKADGSRLRWEETWDFERDAGYTLKEQSAWFRVARHNHKRLIEAVDHIHKKHGKYPLLYANNIYPPLYQPDQVYFQPHKGRQLLEMFCQESATSHTIDESFYEWLKDDTREIKLGRDIVLRDNKYRQNRTWGEYMDNVRDAAYKGHVIGPIIGKAGWKSQLLELLGDEERFHLESYHFASLLLATDAKNTPMYGTTTLNAHYLEPGHRRVPRGRRSGPGPPVGSPTSQAVVPAAVDHPAGSPGPGSSSKFSSRSGGGGNSCTR